MGGVLGKRPRVAAAPEELAEEASLKEKGLAGGGTFSSSAKSAGLKEKELTEEAGLKGKELTEEAGLKGKELTEETGLKETEFTEEAGGGVDFAEDEAGGGVDFAEDEAGGGVDFAEDEACFNEKGFAGGGPKFAEEADLKKKGLAEEAGLNEKELTEEVGLTGKGVADGSGRAIAHVKGKEVTLILHASANSDNGTRGVAKKCAAIGTNVKGGQATFAEAKQESEVTPITRKSTKECSDNGINMKRNEASSSESCSEKVFFPAKEDAENDLDKKPMLKRATEESDEAMDKVLKLSSAAMQLKAHYPQKTKKSKQEYWRSASADTMALAEIVQNSKDSKLCIKTSTKLPRCCIQSCQKLSSAKVVRFIPHTGTNCKSLGWDLIEWKGNFAVPMDSISGNSYVDEINTILFDLMMFVTLLLEEGQVAKSYAIALGEGRETANDVDLCAAIRKLRNTCKSIRAIILNLGYLPLKEPLEFWKKTFDLVKF